MTDVIVVGAGSAGACLAARLAEDREVVLLEAGPRYRRSETPVHLRSLDPMLAFVDPDHQWKGLRAARTERQRPSPYLRGRMVGGSSGINALIAIRGVPGDFDGWAADGCDGWSFQDVLPSFRRLETDLDFGSDAHHGSDGPIPIQRNPQAEWGPVDHALADAACALDYGWCDDHNAPEGTGVSPLAYNADEGGRISTADAYLDPAPHGLTVIGDATVDKVLVEGTRAVGVRARVDGEWRELRASEVAVCAGAVHTPGVLLRSGIGPASEVNRLNGKVVADLPVGQAFADHPMVFFPTVLAEEAQSDAGNVRHINVYVRWTAEEHNDMFLSSLNRAGPADALRGVGGVALGLHEARSRGRVVVGSADPDGQPHIESRLLSEPADMQRMVEGAERVIELYGRPEFAGITTYASYGFTGRPLSELTSREIIEEWLSADCYDVSHACGTCRMGAPDDPRSVVDPWCRVLGIDGLRVVDASIMPAIPRANTHITTVMLAEHAAARW